MTRVLLVDDQALMRAGFRALLDAEDGLEVVGEAADGATAVQLARRLKPDVVLMDVQMPGLDGIEATRRIAADPGLSGVRVLMLTNYGLDEYVFGALRAGASGFCSRTPTRPTCCRPSPSWRAGDALLAPAVTRTLISEFVTRRRRPTRPRGASADRSRAGDGRAGGPRAEQRRDRREPRDQPADREDPHQPGDDEAALPGPAPSWSSGRTSRALIAPRRR
jgi:DNA-binding NarL/FixJ family response regulator